MLKQLRFSLICSTLAVTASVAVANPVPLANPNDLGLARSLIVSGTTPGSSQMGVGGGEFSATINGDSTLLWCIDDQELFSAGDSGFADVILLQNVASQ